MTARAEVPSALNRTFLAVSVLAACIGITLRWIGLFHELWFDEIYSIHFSQRADSLRSLVHVRDAANHVLYGAYVRLLPPHASAAAYRALSFLCGTLSIAFAYRIGRRHSRCAGAIFSSCIALSPFMVIYSTEARGYAPSLLMALAAFDAVFSGGMQSSYVRTVGFWFVCCAGVLFHLQFAPFFFCLALASMASYRKNDIDFRDAVVPFAVPTVFLTLYIAFLFADRVRMGKSLGFSVSSAILDFFTMIFGIPHLAFAVATIAAASVIVLRRRPSDGSFAEPLPTFLIGTVAISVFILFAGLHFENWGIRFVLIPLAFFFLFLSRRIAALCAGGRPLAALTVLLAILLPNAASSISFATTGKGAYDEAFHFMLTQSHVRPLSVGGDHVTLPVMLSHAASQSSEKIFTRNFSTGPDLPMYFHAENIRSLDSDRLPEWFVLESRRSLVDLAPRTIERAGSVYHFQRSFRSFREVGHDWHVYRIADAPVLAEAAANL